MAAACWPLLLTLADLKKREEKVMEMKGWGE
jgi:hypothetical protein